MRSERALGTLGRVFRRLSVVGIAVGIAAGSLWNGCAVTNTEDGRIVDAGMDDGPPPGSDLTCQRRPEEDTPDERFEDSNCDGIDGDITKAKFVSQVLGDDTFIGSREAPVKTIAQGIKLAQQEGLTSVYADKGTYPGSVTLVAGISVYGGYDSGNLWARSATNDTVIQGGTTAVTADKIAQETHLELLTITSQSATSPGQSSYGLYVINSPGPLVIAQSIIRAGDGAPGADGTVGVQGATGGNGGNGQNACSNCNGPPAGGTPGGSGASTCGRTGGRGGTGGQGNGGSGTDGIGTPNSGGGGGKDGTCLVGPNNNPGGNGGSASVNGSNGVNGPAAANIGVANAAGYQPASGGSGTDGGNGNGGGGGGAGGGGGGCGGRAGGGGAGGGASVGIYAVSSKVTLRSSDISSGRGGNGGKGGSGFSGGSGGSGGQGGGPADEAGRGGNGGAGSAGGIGGAGSGGTGGPSFGTWSVSSTIEDPSQTSKFASKNGGGTGGSAGTAPLPLGQAIPGANGLSAPQR